MNIARRFLIGVPYAWLLALFLVPFLIVLKISLSDYAISIPPYTPTLALEEGWSGFKAFWSALDFENFVFLSEDSLYIKAYWSSLKIAALATFLTLLIGFPFAYAIANAPQEWRTGLLMLIILPFWTSFLIRIYALIGIISNEGFLNQFLMWTGIISEPWMIMNTNTAVYIGIVYTYLPFMVSRARSRLHTYECFLVRDDTFGQTRHYRRVFPRLHSGLGRIRDPISLGWLAHLDDW